MLNLQWIVRELIARKEAAECHNPYEPSIIAQNTYFVDSESVERGEK